MNEITTITGELVTDGSKPNKGGRPSTFSWAVVDEICERLAKGEPMAVICRDGHMPSRGTVRTWEDKHPGVSERIARAREDGEDALAADCLSIADDAGSDYRMGEKGLLVDTDHIQRSKLRIETRLKLLAKWNPRKWGEKIDHNHTGKLTLENLVAEAGEPGEGDA